MLSTRIRRLMDGNPAPALSRTRASLVAALCALTVAACAACKLERAVKPAPGQPTMNELERRMAERNKEWNQKRERMLDEVHKLTLEQAQALEMQVKADPQDRDKILKLVRYYQYKVDLKDLDALTLWFIEHRPDQPWAWNINPEWNHDGYAQGKRLWLANLNRSSITKETYQRAAAFMEGGDKPMAERILLEGQRVYPGENWMTPLGMHYAQVVLGSTGPVAEYNVLRTLSMNEAHGPYAQSVRAKLAASNDPHLLMQVAQWVLDWGQCFLGKDNPLDFDIVALARAYTDRALSIQPNYASAQQIKLQLDEVDKSPRVQELAKMSADRRKDVSASDLMLLQADEMNRAWRQYKVDDAEARARELLHLAVRNPSNPEYGDFTFDANIMLGKVALRRGDKRASVRYLLAATETPGSEKLRLGHILMNLPRALLDWGERDAVAQFLERMAPKTTRSGEFQDWAEQIRKGINPDLTPLFSGCSQAPC